jgi:signal transduction histidine kinase
VSPAKGNALTPAQLAHELNNLLDGSLRSVSLVMHRLQDELPDTVDTTIVDKYLHTADRSMRQMAEVIERYANQSETPAAADRAVLDRRGSLLDALTHAANVYGPVIEQRGIELTTRLDATVSPLPAGAVYTVLANGINNALQAIERSAQPGPHRIAIRLVQDAGEVVVQVADTADGLAPEVIDRDGRFRFGVTTRPQGHGIGLGVCRQIAEDLNGTLTIRNGDDGGAVLTLRYPAPATSVSRCKPAGWAPAVNTSGGGGGGGGRRAG